MLAKMIGIYKITNPNGRIYIGQSTNIEDRWNKYRLLNCKDQPSLYSSLKKHGPINHKFEIIEECTEKELDKKEIYWGEFFDVLSNKHLNNRLGRGFGSYDSEETKLKKRLCHKGRSNYWLKDKKFSKEHCKKISEAKKGVPQNRTKVRSDKGESKTFHVNSVVKAKSKPILQFDKNNNFLTEWSSGKEASKILNIPQPNINSCCNKKVKSAGGFVWKFKDI
jgi:group I intron endonuclease